MTLLLLLGFYLHAEPLVSPEAWLQHPIDVRAREFGTLKDHGYTFLSKPPFNSKEALQVRWRAITTMGKADPIRFHKEIDRALGSPEWFIRNAALIALLSD